nr:hypothetical protein [Microbacterium lacticum]
MPVRIGEADVEVADGCLVRGAADGRFLHEPLGDLLGEVQGVELRDRGHDAVHEHPGGRLINVLHHRDQGDPGLAQRGVDDRVIEPVPGDPVDLVDDAVPDGMLSEVVQHLLEGFAASGLAGLAGLDELFDDDRTELLGLALRGLALRRDGQTLFEAVAGGLVLGGDPQVGDRRHLPIGKGDIEGLGRGAGEGTQGAEVEAGRKVEERHGRDCLSGAHPFPSRDGCGRRWAVTTQMGRPAEPRRVRATKG